MNKENLERYNISLAVPSDLRDFVFSLSNKIEDNEELVYKLDNNHDSHITIYSAVFKKENLEEIKNKVSKISDDFPPILLKNSNLNVRRVYLALELKLTEEIQKLHKSIVNSLLNLSFKGGDLLDNKFKEYSKKELKSLRKYGSRNVFDNFTPHVTLAKFADNNIAIKEKDILLKQYSNSKVSKKSKSIELLNKDRGVIDSFSF